MASAVGIAEVADAANKIMRATTTELTLWLLKVHAGEAYLFEWSDDSSDKFDDMIEAWVIDATNHSPVTTPHKVCQANFDLLLCTAVAALEGEMTRVINEHKTIMRTTAGTHQHSDIERNHVLTRAACDLYKRVVTPACRKYELFKCLFDARRASRFLLGLEWLGSDYDAKKNFQALADKLNELIASAEPGDVLCVRLKSLVNNFEEILSCL